MFSFSKFSGILLILTVSVWDVYSVPHHHRFQYRWNSDSNSASTLRRTYRNDQVTATPESGNSTVETMTTEPNNETAESINNLSSTITTERVKPTTRIPFPNHHFDPETVNKGVNAILRGVSTFRLSEILRGSFMFTRNENVNRVANNVIDTIFGKRNETGISDNDQGIFPLTWF